MGSSTNVTHLLIMDQVATHSSCETTDKGNEQIASFAAENPSLQIVAWAHTHPRQDADIDVVT